MPWILGSIVKDFGAFYLTPCVLILIAMIAPDWLWWPTLGFLVYQWFDVGHAFPTMFRVAPRWGSALLFSALLPLVIFAVLVAGFWLNMRWTLVAVVYLTVFHHVRQFYGISRWYQYLNQRPDNGSGFYLYILTLLPLLLVHFREDLQSSQFAWAQLPHFENPDLEIALKLILAAAWIGWGIFEFFRARRFGLELNRVLSVFLPAFLHYWCFTQAPTIEAMLFPLLTIHALTYFFVVDQRSGKRRANIFILFMAGFAGGTLVFGLESLSERLPSGPLSAALVGLALTPTIWHYVIDGFIWRKTDLI